MRFVALLRELLASGVHGSSPCAVAVERRRPTRFDRRASLDAPVLESERAPFNSVGPSPADTLR
jgi:hypothetical protein